MKKRNGNILIISGVFLMIVFVSLIFCFFLDLSINDVDLSMICLSLSILIGFSLICLGSAIKRIPENEPVTKMVIFKLTVEQVCFLLSLFFFFLYCLFLETEYVEGIVVALMLGMASLGAAFIFWTRKLNKRGRKTDGGQHQTEKDRSEPERGYIKRCSICGREAHVATFRFVYSKYYCEDCYHKTFTIGPCGRQWRQPDVKVPSAADKAASGKKNVGEEVSERALSAEPAAKTQQELHLELAVALLLAERKTVKERAQAEKERLEREMRTQKMCVCCGMRIQDGVFYFVNDSYYCKDCCQNRFPVHADPQHPQKGGEKPDLQTSPEKTAKQLYLELAASLLLLERKNLTEQAQAEKERLEREGRTQIKNPSEADGLCQFDSVRFMREYKGKIAPYLPADITAEATQRKLIGELCAVFPGADCLKKEGSLNALGAGENAQVHIGKIAAAAEGSLALSPGAAEDCWTDIPTDRLIRAYVLLDFYIFVRQRDRTVNLCAARAALGGALSSRWQSAGQD